MEDMYSSGINNNKLIKIIAIIFVLNKIALILNNDIMIYANELMIIYKQNKNKLAYGVAYIICIIYCNSFFVRNEMQLSRVIKQQIISIFETACEGEILFH